MRPFSTLLRATTLTVIGLFAFIVPANAQTVLADRHVDFDIAYEEDVFSLLIHDDDSDQEFDPATSIFFVPEEAEGTRPGGAEADTLFPGIAEGAPLWTISTTPIPGQLIIGVASTEVPAGVFQGGGEFSDGLITLELVSFSGPGQFAMWRNTPVFDPAFISGDGINPAEDFAQSEAAAQHVDYNFGFTAPGLYALTVQARGTLLNGTEVVSDQTTYFFGVETTSLGNAAPEPATLALVGAGLFTVGIVKRRRK